MEVGGEVHGDICGRRLRRRRLREKMSWRDRGVRGMEVEGGSKYMKMVVRETIAWATLERGDSSKPNSHRRKASTTINPLAPPKISPRNFQKVYLRGSVLDAQRFQH